MKHLTKLFRATIAIAIMLCVALPTFAHDFEVNGIYYNYLDETAKTVEVTYKGSDYFSYSNEYTGAVSIPSSVTYSGITYSVTTIGSDAFSYCSGLTSVTIPNSVTSIGSSAFYRCSGLTSVTIPNSVTSIGSSAFSGCSGLTSVTIPNSVTTIASSAFSGCSGLTSVTIPNSVTTIASSAFYNTGWYNNQPDGILYLDNCCLGYKGNKPTGTLSIKEGTRLIGSSAFSGCSGLTSVTIPNSATSIGSSAFSGCSGLTSVTIPNSVTSIDWAAFSGCTGLTSIVVEKGNTKYDSRDNCNAIIETATNTLMSGCKNTTIPNSVTSIGDYAFSGCSGLTSVTIPNSVTSIGWAAFSGCTGLTSVTIGNSVTSIGFGAFTGCSGLTSVTIGNSVTTIGDKAFDGCSGLTSVTIGNSVTSIGSSAFDDCNIPVLHLPKSVTYVGEYNVCADVCYCYNPTPPSGGGRTSDRLFVPKGSLMAYATAEGWKDAEQILEFEVDDVVKPILTIAYPEGGVIKQTVDNGEILMLQIVPANGWKCNSVTFNGIDVTNQLDANGNYNTPSITANSQLSIVFVKNDGSVANALVDSDIKVYVKGNTVTITGADEFSDVEIYNTAGTTIYTGIDKSITIDSTGIYILTVEGRTFKFAM